MRERLRDHPGVALVLVAYVAVAVLYGVAIPIFESPDAGGHYAYIHELTEGRGLPVHGAPSGERVTGYVAGHPPLYYALCAALTFWVPDDADFADWAWRNPYVEMGNPGSVANKNYLVHTPAERFPWRGTPLTVHIARLISTALGALAVVATYGIALELFPDRRWLAWGAAALTAFNPMFVFTAARVSNDAAVAAFGSLALWGGVRLAVRGLSRPGLGLLGVAVGLAALSKLSGTILVPVVAFALLLDAARNGQYALGHVFRKERLVRLFGNALILFGATTFVCGWWFVRNLLLYGELLGVNAWLSHTATVRSESIGFLEVISELKGFEKSYWAVFGWFNVGVAPWMYRVWWVVVRASIVGLVLVLVDQSTRRRLPGPAQAGLAIVGLAFLLIFGSVWRFIMIVLGAQGRYLMPAVTAISVLMMFGLSRLLPRRWTPVLAVPLGLGQLTLAVVCLLVFILPAYAAPKAVDERELPADLVRFDLAFEGTPVRLLGGHIEADEARPGSPLPVSLYWQAVERPREDLVALIQVLDWSLEPIAGADCYPGRGTFPPTLWQPGVTYRDRYVLQIAPGANAPTVASLYTGLRHPASGHLTATLPSGEQAPAPLLLDDVPIRPTEPLPDDVTYSVGARLGEAITLVGYDITAEELQAGEAFTVTVVWRAEARPERDYTAFVHLMDASGALVAQDDHPPLGGRYSTSFWAPGEVVRDRYRLTLEEDQPPCICVLQVGMYDPELDVRVPAYDNLGGHFEDDAVGVGGITVE